MSADCRIHTWTNDGDTWTCTNCQQTSATCIITKPSDDGEGHPTGSSLPICDNCLAGERELLNEITDALGHWQHQPRSLVPAIRYDRDKIHRGSGRGERPDTINHPVGVLTILWSWADMWAEATDTEATDLGFLHQYIMWAATNPDTSAWNDWRREMRQMRHAARRVAGLLPKKKYGPCVHCGGTVVQDWADQRWQPLPGGLDDTLRCTGCHLTWRDHDTWAFTNRHTIQLLPDVRPDSLVTLEDARQIFPDVPAGTWRLWQFRDNERPDEEKRMPVRGHNTRGLPLYRLENLTAMAEHRRSDTRPGRRATA